MVNIETNNQQRLNTNNIKDLQNPVLIYNYTIKVGRGFLTHLFYVDPLPHTLIILPTHSSSFQILSTHIPPSPPPLPQAPPNTQTLLFLLTYFIGWMGDRATFDVLFYLIIMGLKIMSLSTIVSERPCYVFYAKKCHVYWVLTYSWLFTSTLIWYHTHKNTQRTQKLIDWQTHVNIY